jgi:hypothetical protein
MKLEGKLCSRKHAAIGFDPHKEHVYLSDLSSAHGTYVDEKREEASQDRAGDLVWKCRWRAALHCARRVQPQTSARGRRRQQDQHSPVQSCAPSSVCAALGLPTPCMWTNPQGQAATHADVTVPAPAKGKKSRLCRCLRREAKAAADAAGAATWAPLLGGVMDVAGRGVRGGARRLARLPQGQGRQL